MNNIGGMQTLHLRGTYYDNKEEIIPGKDQESELQRHHGIGMGQIMRKGVGVKGQVVNKDQWGEEGGHNPLLCALPR